MPSKIILYGVHMSPPVRAVHLTLEALGLEYEFKEVDTLSGAHLKPEYLKMNPQHTVPTLEDIDGKYIWDSHAIIAYLVRKYGKDDSLYPKDFYQRAVVDQRLHYENGVLFMGLGRNKLGGIMRGEAKKADIPDMVKAVNEAYDLLEIFIGENNYIAGENLTVADFSIVTTLTALINIAPVESAKYPKLSAWFERIKKLPYFDLVNEEGSKQLSTRINDKLKELS